MKFQLNYKLTVSATTGVKLSDTANHPFAAVIVTPPLTLQFDVKRSTAATCNNATFTITNLGEETRNRIYQDQFDVTAYKFVILEVGYGDDLSMVFSGQIRHAHSSRRGTEWITTIDAWDNFGAINGTTNKTLPAGVDFSTIFNQVSSDMPELNDPIISGALTSRIVSRRGVSLMGNSWLIAKRWKPVDHQLFIDNNTMHLMHWDEYVSVGIPVISSGMGLLETPRRDTALIHVKLLLEPRLIMAQAIALESADPRYNSQYKIVGIHHSGTISETVGGGCTTELDLFLGTGLLRSIV